MGTGKSKRIKRPMVLIAEAAEVLAVSQVTLRRWDASDFRHAGTLSTGTASMILVPCFASETRYDLAVEWRDETRHSQAAPTVSCRRR